jgi:hypothetical protein
MRTVGEVEWLPIVSTIPENKTFDINGAATGDKTTHQSRPDEPGSVKERNGSFISLADRQSRNTALHCRYVHFKGGWRGQCMNAYARLKIKQCDWWLSPEISDVGGFYTALLGRLVWSCQMGFNLFCVCSQCFNKITFVFV